MRQYIPVIHAVWLQSLYSTENAGINELLFEAHVCIEGNCYYIITTTECVPYVCFPLFPTANDFKLFYFFAINFTMYECMNF